MGPGGSPKGTPRACGGAAAVLAFFGAGLLKVGALFPGACGGERGQEGRTASLVRGLDAVASRIHALSLWHAAPLGAARRGAPRPKASAKLFGPRLAASRPCSSRAEADPRQKIVIRHIAALGSCC